MKLAKLLSTAVLVFLPGAIVPACAQEHRDQEKQPEQKQQQAKPAQKQQRAEQKQQPAKPAQEQHRAEQKQQPAKPAPQQQRAAQQQPNRAAPRGNHGRIPGDRFRASFGSGHTFHVNRAQFAGGSRRFQYGGYWFAMANPWPVGWLYTDSVYVDYINRGYFLCDPVHPGVNISINIG